VRTVLTQPQLLSLAVRNTNLEIRLQLLQLRRGPVRGHMVGQVAVHLAGGVEPRKARVVDQDRNLARHHMVGVGLVDGQVVGRYVGGVQV
jgi:hypothetical protein